MSFRNLVIGVLLMVMVSPAWGNPEPVGNITSSSDASIQHLPLTPGSTVFNGDTISVSEKGAARIALIGGAQAEVIGDSAVELGKSKERVRLVLDRGQMSFRTSADTVDAMVGDASVHPAAVGETYAVIQTLSDARAVVFAQKGALLLTTAHDSKVYTIPEGDAAMLAPAPDPQQGGGAVPAGKSSAPSARFSKTAFYVVTAIVVGAGIGVGIYFAHRESQQSTTSLQNEISPFKLQ